MFENGIKITDAGAKQNNLEVAFDLIDPLALMELAHVHWYGATKYSPDNWRGITIEDHINHAIAHLYKFLLNKEKEELTHAFCRICFALAKYLRPDYTGSWKPKK